MRDMTPSRQAQAGLARTRVLRIVKSTTPAHARGAGPAPACPLDEIERPAFLDRSEPKDLTELVAQASEVGNQVLVLCGVRPETWLHSYTVVASWLRSGADPEVDIYPTVLRLAQGNPNYTPPRTGLGLKYFTAAIAEARSKRLAGPNGSDPDFDPERSRWEGRCSGWHKRGFWIPNWGSKPGEPGCRAPSEIVGKYGGETP